jgi:SAM-dependent methyltransferase
MKPKLDGWVRDILVDPFSKEPIGEIPSGIPDFRRKLFSPSIDAKTWRSGQEHFESWAEALKDSADQHRAELATVRGVYEDISLDGRVLDVGGYQGRLRAYLADGQEYVSCDPHIGAFNGIEQQPNLLEIFGCLKEPCNFVACHAEHLPFKSASFDTVHMRSVIDHFLDPALALIEARRVLRRGGKLIVGLYVEGGRRGRMTPIESAKEMVKRALPFLDRDHHVWHPTYRELVELIGAAGFSISKVHWQAGTNDRVCYIEAMKSD